MVERFFCIQRRREKAKSGLELAKKTHFKFCYKKSLEKMGAGESKKINLERHCFNDFFVTSREKLL